MWEASDLLPSEGRGKPEAAPSVVVEPLGPALGRLQSGSAALLAAGAAPVPGASFEGPKLSAAELQEVAGEAAGLQADRLAPREVGYVAREAGWSTGPCFCDPVAEVSVSQELLVDLGVGGLGHLRLQKGQPPSQTLC